jgi:shikimate kinase / 3-dehydroquinate synthase
VDTPIAERHLALIGFMGAGKTTVGARVAERLDRRFVDLDQAVERGEGVPVEELLERGDFRTKEEAYAVRVLARRPPTVIALGGGAVASGAVREALRLHARTVLLEVEVDEAWRRASRTRRPLARDEAAFRELYKERRPLYAEAGDATAADEDGVVLAAAGVHVETGALGRLGDLVPGEGPVGLVADAQVSGVHGVDAQLALGGRLRSSHDLPPGEQAKTLAACERLWSDLTLDRAATLVALGGGSTTDTVGFVAATFLRGLPWVAVPTTLVGQVDAAVGGKTGIDLEQGKNLVGAFHWPARTIIDPGLLQTLPERELSAGMAEVVKSGLVAGEPFWELPLPALVRRTAAFKAGICLRDPFDHGYRTTLNLGHTFAHALEAASGYTLAHGRAVALGLMAALRLSGLPTDVVDEVLSPEPVRVDPDEAWAALKRDKKGAGVYVLLEEVGRPMVATLPDAEARRALNELIAR